MSGAPKAAVDGAHRIASLDLLRGSAAFAVAIPHFLLASAADTHVLEAASSLAVEIFFVLSGFVLAPQIMLCFRSRAPGALGTFLVRRWLRTVPPYIVALIAITVLNAQPFAADFWRYAFYVQNLLAQHNAVDYFSIAWSLSVEEWFYLTFPGLMLIMSPIFPRGARGAVIFAALFIAGVTALRSAFADLQNWGPEVRRVVLFRVDSIAYGFLLYLFSEWLAKRRWASALKFLVVPALALFFVSAMLASFSLTLQISEGGSDWLKNAFPFAAAAFGIAAVSFFRVCAPLVAAVPGLARVAIFLGQISYSVYLFHLVLSALVQSNAGALSINQQLGIYLIAMCVFSAIFYHFFEAPILAARPRFQRVPE